MRQGCGTPSGGSPENRPEKDFEWESGEAKGLPIVAPRRCHGTTRWYAWGRHRPVTGEKAHICGAFGSALGRTRTCDLLIRSDRFGRFADPHWVPFGPYLRGFCSEVVSLDPYKSP
jgi:hypothetical protein